jgi:YVTN family beta-propeller protein
MHISQPASAQAAARSVPILWTPHPREYRFAPAFLAAALALAGCSRDAPTSPGQELAHPLIAAAAMVQPSVIATIPIPGCPQGVTVNSTTGRVYATSFDDGTVSVIDAASNTVVATIPVGTGPTHPAVNETTNRIYVPNISSNTVSVIDGSDNSLIATVPVGSTPTSLAVNPITNRIYVANQSVGGGVSVIDGNTNIVVATTATDAPRVGVAVNPATNRIYATSGSNVVVIDGATDVVVATVGLNNAPQLVAVNSTTNRIYIPEFFGNDVSVINGSDNTILATITVDISPTFVAVNPATNHIYTTSGNNGASLVIIDGATSSVLSSTPLFSSPRGIAVDPSTGRVYAEDCGDNTVKVIQEQAPIHYTFQGFFQPVDNPSVATNTANAGSSIPVKFKLGGNQGLDIFRAGDPTSYPKITFTDCTTAATLDAIETTTANPSGLSYDAATDTYTYVWKTDKAWGNRCGTFQLGLKDGSDHHALFKFKK